MKTNSISNILYVSGLLITTAFIFGLYLLFASYNHFPEIEPIINGTGTRPFVYRVLPSLFVRFLSTTLQVSYDASAIIMMYVCLLAFAVTMNYLCMFFLPKQNHKIAVYFSLIGILPFLIYQRHIYDFPILFLTTLALYLLVSKNFKLYILIFALASLTKETSLFLILFFILHFRNLDKKFLFTWAGLQIVIYAIIRLTIMFIFRHNPGAGIEFHFTEHISTYIQHPWRTAILFSVIIFYIVSAFSLQGNNKEFIKDVLFAMGFPLLILYFISGIPFEVRLFIEIYPILFLAMVLRITHLTTPYLKKTGSTG